MIVFDYELIQGFVLPLSELKECLPSMDRGAHQWRVNPELRVRDRRTYAAIEYSNPEETDMPNAICYLFPVVDDGGKDPMVCLHPTAVIPVVQGLYFEGPELKQDLLEDWGRFWEPLRRAVASRSPDFPAPSD